LIQNARCSERDGPWALAMLHGCSMAMAMARREAYDAAIFGGSVEAVM